MREKQQYGREMIHAGHLHHLCFAGVICGCERAAKIELESEQSGIHRAHSNVHIVHACVCMYVCMYSCLDPVTD